MKEEKQQSVRSNGCENIYPQPRSVDERIAKCGTADSKSVSGGSKTSPVDRIWSLPSPKRSEKVTGNYRNNFRLREFGQKYWLQIYPRQKFSVLCLEREYRNKTT